MIRVDEARLRGEDGVCETAEGAEVPVDVAIGTILADAFVKVLSTDGVDVFKVAHPGRYRPVQLDTAIQERDNWRCVRPVAVRPSDCRFTTTKSTTANRDRRCIGTWQRSASATTTSSVIAGTASRAGPVTGNGSNRRDERSD